MLHVAWYEHLRLPKHFKPVNQTHMSARPFQAETYSSLEAKRKTTYCQISERWIRMLFVVYLKKKNTHTQSVNFTAATFGYVWSGRKPQSRGLICRLIHRSNTGDKSQLIETLWGRQTTNSPERHAQKEREGESVRGMQGPHCCCCCCCCKTPTRQEKGSIVPAMAVEHWPLFISQEQSVCFICFDYFDWPPLWHYCHEAQSAFVILIFLFLFLFCFLILRK